MISKKKSSRMRLIALFVFLKMSAVSCAIDGGSGGDNSEVLKELGVDIGNEGRKNDNRSSNSFFNLHSAAIVKAAFCFSFSLQIDLNQGRKMPKLD